ncbi:MAG TPA: Uma2 family endonuclease [Acidimicrobiales bacterium]|nr:Uma2 family endonuclease [Acidimicrobiales bacterium]
MAMVRTPITVADYFDVAADVPEHTQLIDGVIVRSQPTWRHQRATGLIYARLLAWTESAAGFGVAGLPIDVILDDHDVYAPDVWWIAEPARVRPDEHFRGVPDVAVEVRSPSTWRYDTGIKKQRYEQHGLPELWLVDTTAQAVVVHRRSSPAAPAFDVETKVTSGEDITSALLPCFALGLDDILRD